MSFLRLAYRKKLKKKRCRKCGEKKNGECRCRQGRNHESRQRAKRSFLLSNDPSLKNDRCLDCGGYNLDIDYKSSDVICIDCGLVLDSFGFWDHIDSRISFSKKYQTLVYMREKLRGYHGTDPFIWKDEWRLIKEYIRKNVPHYELEKMGQSTFSKICRSIEVEGKYPLATKKYGERYIQARKKLGLSVPEPMSSHLLFMILTRTEIYQRAHREIFQYNITKKNAINLNYVLLQFILLDAPDEFETWKRWIKLSFGKLDHYNKIWKDMIVELGTHYDYFIKDEMIYTINWAYNRLSVKDLWIREELEIT